MTESQKRIYKMCAKRRIPVSTVESALGFSNGYLMHERQKEFPIDRLKRVADYFSVPVSYLTGGQELNPVADLTDEEWRLINLYRAADSYDKETIQRVLNRYQQDTSSAVG